MSDIQYKKQNGETPHKRKRKTMTHTQEMQKFTGLVGIYAEEVQGYTLDQLLEEKTKWTEQIEKEGYGGAETTRDLLHIVTTTIMNK